MSDLSDLVISCGLWVSISATQLAAAVLPTASSSRAPSGLALNWIPHGGMVYGNTAGEQPGMMHVPCRRQLHRLNLIDRVGVVAGSDAGLGNVGS